MHGGSPEGAECIAARWAGHRKVPQIVFKPDWARHGKAAPFKRNDQMLEAMPIGVVVFPGSGKQDFPPLNKQGRRLGTDRSTAGEPCIRWVRSHFEQADSRKDISNEDSRRIRNALRFSATNADDHGVGHTLHARV
jgi:hypothetical protein